MILIIFPDSIKCMDDTYPMALQLGLRADGRKHQNLRRMIHASAEHNLVRGGGMLVTVFSVTNAFGFPAAKNERHHRRVTDDLEIGASTRRTEIRDGRRLPP